MADAEVGDDVYMEDPTVNRLQERAAQIFGKEAGLYVPSGTMGNQIAIRAHTNPAQEVILEAHSHIYEFEMAAMAVISGTQPRPVSATDGILTWESIRNAIRPKIYYRAQTGLIALENTHNMAGGMVYTKAQIDDICRHAHDVGLPVHMDGARIFNAAIALGIDVSSLVAECDSVMFCLSKGLCAPVGSVLLGSKSFIEKARSIRKMLGGGMRQAGILAAAGLVALEKMPPRLVEDHENARLLTELLRDIPELQVPTGKVLTNIIMLEIASGDFSSDELAGQLKEKGVLVSVVDSRRLRLVTHRDVSREQIHQAADAIAQCVAKHC